MGHVQAEAEFEQLDEQAMVKFIELDAGHLPSCPSRVSLLVTNHAPLSLASSHFLDFSGNTSCLAHTLLCD